MLFYEKNLIINVYKITLEHVKRKNHSTHKSHNKNRTLNINITSQKNRRKHQSPVLQFSLVEAFDQG
jgi:hypothetical protein